MKIMKIKSLVTGLFCAAQMAFAAPAGASQLPPPSAASIVGSLPHFFAAATNAGTRGLLSSKKVMYFGNSTVWNATAWFSAMQAATNAGGVLNGIPVFTDVTNISSTAGGVVTVTTTAAHTYTVGAFVTLEVTTGATQCIGSGIVTGGSGTTSLTLQASGTMAANCLSVGSTASTGSLSQQILNFGNNGGTLASMLANTSATGTGVGGICAVKPDLLVARGPLINDVRTGVSNLTQSIAMMQQLITTVHGCSPNTDIYLKTENPLLTTDVGSNGYVVPNASAQAYSVILEQAVMAMANQYPYVMTVDTQALLWGQTSPATSAWMADQLHPNATGVASEAAFDLQIWAQVQSNNQTLTAQGSTGALGSAAPISPNTSYAAPFSPWLAANARAQSYATPWTFYPHACADPDYYDLVATAPAYAAGYSAGATGFIFLWPGAAAGQIQIGDVVEQQTAGCWPLILPSVGNSSGNTFVNLNASQTLPYAIAPSEKINIWRPKYGNVAAEPYVKGGVGYPYKHRVYIVSGGSGYFDISFPASERIKASQSAITTSDTLILANAGAVSIASCTFGTNSVNMRCLTSGSFAGMINDYGYVFGTHPMESTLDNNGHLRTLQTNKPVLSSCGTSPTILGSDVDFEITTGTSATTCTFTPNVAYSAKPICTLYSPSAMTYSISSAGVITFSSVSAAQVIDGHCSAQIGG